MKLMAAGSRPRTDRQEAKEAALVRARLLLALFLAFGAPLRAQEPIGLGPSFVVNNPSAFPQGAPSVSRLQDGGFVVSWQSIDNGGSTELSIQARLFDAGGSPADQLQVNNHTRDEEWVPDVEVLADGSFVIAWAGIGDVPAQRPDIKGRLFSATGEPLGEEFRVNANTVDQQWGPKVLALEGGGFFVTWLDQGGGGIAGRRFDAAGQPVGFESQLNNVPGVGVPPVVSSDGGAGFVVVWRQNMPDGSEDDHSFSVQARLFTADGVPRGPQFLINTYTPETQRHPAVSPDGSGGFVVVWNSFGGFGSDTGSSVQAQRLRSDGARVGGQFQVNTTTTGSQKYPAVEEDGTGGFVVAWTDGSAAPSYRLQGQRFSPDGQPTGQEFPVDAEATASQFRSRIDDIGVGRFVVVWPEGNNVKGRRFVVPLFADGFESGDTSAWTTTVP